MLMNVKSLLLSSLMVWLLSVVVYAQTYTMAQPVITGCAGVLHDTGGETEGYGSNENLISSIFAGIPGAAIYMRLTDASFGTGDTLWIYDGGSVLSPLLAELSAPSSNWIGRSFFPLNTNGSVTVRFKSNSDSSTGNFHFTFSCNTCQGIRPVIEPQDVIRICQGSAVVLDGSLSVAPEGTSIAAYIWQSDDTATGNATVFSHTYNEPGVYYASLLVQLNNGCTTPIPAYQRIEVSGLQAFNLTSSSDSVCIGQEVNFDLNISSFSVSNALTGPGGYIPDSPGAGLETVIEFSGSNGAVINSTADIGLVSLNIEHSFLADMYITLECPSGQSMVLYAGVNGGGIWLGIPIDEVNDLTGTGFTYTFDPLVTSPALGLGGAEYILPVINAQGGTGNAVLPGSYAADGLWSDLIGCPVDGPWTLTLTDQAGADDGTLFSWELGLSAVSFTGLSQGFSTGGGANCSTLQWTGPGAIVMNDDCTTASLLPESSGWQLYEVEGTSSYGCPISGDLLVFVENPINGYVTTVDALGGNPGSAEVHANEEGGPYEIVWSTGSIGGFTEGNLGGGQYWVQVSNAIGCSERYTFLIETDQSIAENSLSSGSIRFDPQNKLLLMSSNEDVNGTFALVDAQGRSLRSWTVAGVMNASWDVSGLVPGVYLVHHRHGLACRFVVE
jgi:subtilisin-like proprotein convertase family protein